MTLRRARLFALFVLHVLCLESFACMLEAKGLGLAVDMIHRDSLLSPLYNPLQTPSERYKNAMNWSIRLLHRLNTNDTSVESQVVIDNVMYLIKYSIGSPPTEQYGIVDTGSDLPWIQCDPCISCYKQRFPIFDPEKSTSYKDVPCASQQCQLLQHVCSSNNSCEYTYAYGGGSYTNGNLATETLTLTSSSGQPFPLPNIVFGCGHNNTGPSENQTGIFGMGGGPLSLVNQIGSSLGSLKFFQCLVPYHTSPTISSKLIFGTDETASGKNISSTPLVRKDDKTYYFVTLNGFSVGENFVPFQAQNGTVQKGNMFFDSGTPPIILPQDLYNRMESAVKGAIPLQPIPEMSPQLCYHGDDKGINAPKITVHYDGADVVLNPINIFIPVDNGVYCFTMTNTTAENGIFGNYAQSNFLIGFDLDKNIISFMPKDCTRND